MTESAANNDMTKWRSMRAVGVECQGFCGSALVLKKKGVVWLWLSAEQQQAICDAFPKDRRWMVDDRLLARVKSEYPRFLLGYTEDGGRCSRPKIGLHGMEDALVDAVQLRDVILENWRDLSMTIGSRRVVALVQAALGSSVTGEFAPEGAHGS